MRTRYCEIMPCTRWVNGTCWCHHTRRVGVACTLLSVCINPFPKLEMSSFCLVKFTWLFPIYFYTLVMWLSLLSIVKYLLTTLTISLMSTQTLLSNKRRHTFYNSLTHCILLKSQPITSNRNAHHTSSLQQNFQARICFSLAAISFFSCISCQPCVLCCSQHVRSCHQFFSCRFWFHKYVYRNMVLSLV